MTDRPPDPRDRTYDPDAEEQPGSDAGAAYERAVETGQVHEPEENPTDGPDAGDVFRSGS